jgi:hypothetical protein
MAVSIRSYCEVGKLAMRGGDSIPRAAARGTAVGIDIVKVK